MRWVKWRLLGLSALVLGVSFLIFPNSLRAQEEISATADYDDIVGGVGLIFTGICDAKAPPPEADDPCDCREKGVCTVDDLLQLLVNVATLILGISGSVVLLMFIYGGFRWITSRGSAEDVQAGRQTMVRAVIGFTIIISAYTLINFLIASLAGQEEGETLQETIDNLQNPPTTTPPALPPSSP